MTLGWPHHKKNITNFSSSTGTGILGGSICQYIYISYIYIYHIYIYHIYIYHIYIYISYVYIIYIYHIYIYISYVSYIYVYIICIIYIYISYCIYTLEVATPIDLLKKRKKWLVPFGWWHKPLRNFKKCCETPYHQAMAEVKNPWFLEFHMGFIHQKKWPISLQEEKVLHVVHRNCPSNCPQIKTESHPEKVLFVTKGPKKRTSSQNHPKKTPRRHGTAKTAWS